MTIAPVRDDPAGWARRLGISREAVDLYVASEVVDIHVESFIWPRVFGYDLGRWHDRSVTRHRFLGQADLPRLTAAGLSGAVMSIATNPFRTVAGRRGRLGLNVASLRRTLADNGVVVVSGISGYERARHAGRMAAFLALQGGNALTADDLSHPSLDDVSRITLVHLTRSRLGSSSAPLGGGGGLTAEGRRFVEAAVDRSIVVDLAHASSRTFWDALAVAPRDVPAIVSHGAVWSERPSWRNVDDTQIRAIAERGGVVGIMLHRGFLARPGRRASAADVARHVAHVIRVAGDDTPGLGSDFDGMIVPPGDLATVLDLPRVVQAMLDRGLATDTIAKVLGANYLRVMAAVRGGG